MMVHLNGRRVVLGVVCLALVVLFGCTGKKGPMGPPGAGTRTVYTGTVPATADSYFVAIPGMTLSDPPLVSSFVQISPNEFDELPLVFQFQGDTTVSLLYGSIRDGGVTLWFCHDLDYMIIVIQ